MLPHELPDVDPRQTVIVGVGVPTDIEASLRHSLREANARIADLEAAVRMLGGDTTAPLDVAAASLVLGAAREADALIPRALIGTGDDDDELGALELELEADDGSVSRPLHVQYDQPTGATAESTVVCDDPSHPLTSWWVGGGFHCVRCGERLSDARRAAVLAPHP